MNFGGSTITFGFNWLYFFLFLIVVILFTYFNYRFTLPPISKPKKFILLFLRTLSLFTLLFLTIEPSIVFAKKSLLLPKHYLFIDKSKSILLSDNVKRDSLIKVIADKFTKSSFGKNVEVFTFGDTVESIAKSEVNKLSFDAPVTNYNKIFNSITDKNNEAATITILSDGVITDGANPQYLAEKLGIPVYSVCIGDSTKKRDVAIQSVYHSDEVYFGSTTSLAVNIFNSGFKGLNTTLELYEDNRLVSSKSISLTDEGIISEKFEYTPRSIGEKKITVKIDNIDREYTTSNNSNTFFVKVLSNKINALIIAGAPSSDISFLKNSLKSDTTYRINSFIALSGGNYIEGGFNQKVADSADVIFLVNFPSSNTSEQMLQYVKDAIFNKNKPFFFLAGGNLDRNKLTTLQDKLPFVVNKVFGSMVEVYPYITEQEKKNPLLQNSELNIVDSWNNLPPVYRPDWDVKAKAESKVIAKIKISNMKLEVPLIITKQVGGSRSIAVVASDIWKWKLGKAQTNSDLYDRFISNSLKWLNAKEDRKQVNVTTLKRVYSKGERIEFYGEVYDGAFNPLSDAVLSIDIVTPKQQHDKIILSSIGAGVYEGFYKASESGDFSYNAEAKSGNDLIGSSFGRFNIGDIDVESITPNSDCSSLTALSQQTNGKFFYNGDYKNLIKMLEQIDKKEHFGKVASKEFRLWSDPKTLYLLILLFAIEWFLRKRFGLI